MPTLTRPLLLFACLLLGPLVVIADELPKDTNTIESLTVEQSRKLAAEFKGVNLFLDGLTTLDAATAKVLAEFKGQTLHLNGLTTLDTATAKAIAEFKGQPLCLNGLTTLDAATAKVLAEFKAWGGQLQKLTTLDVATAKAIATSEKWNGQLPAITAFESRDSIAIAQALATRTGPLSLPNLKKISPKTLTALIEKEDVEIPLIETLELIPEPDGSVTEDFVIPDGFQQRQSQASRNSIE